MSEYEVTIHPQSDVHHTVGLGHGTRIYAWSILMEGATLGRDCMVATCVEIGRRVRMGDQCRVQHGTAICDGAILGDRVFIGSCVSLADCRYPQVAAKEREIHEPPVLEDDVVVGCNAVILPGVRVGRGAQIGAGAVVSRDVPAGWVVAGVPARRLMQPQPLSLAMHAPGPMGYADPRPRWEINRG